MTDLLARTAELIDIPSVSHDERAIADRVEAELRAVPGLTVDRLVDNVVARTDLGREQRIVLAGHLDTVPVNDNDRARIDGDVLHGLGASDMKGGLAVFLELAKTVTDPTVDVTWVFYVCEEVEQRFNGLRHLLADRPDLLACDAAVLGEPTNAVVEAGCQGTLRAAVTLAGERAHTARPWMGRNAIHRLAPVLDRLAAYEERRPVLDGCEYREALQAVKVMGGVAGNVVPDAVTLTVNHRFAPDRTPEQATDHVRSVLAEGGVEEGDTWELVDAVAGAPPGLTHPLLQQLVAATGTAPVAKLGWTDVAFFASHGIPACNFGPGDPTIAHTKNEHVTRSDLDRAYATLSSLLTTPPA